MIKNSNSLPMSWDEFLKRYLSFGEEIYFEYDNYKIWLSRGDDFYLTKYQTFKSLDIAEQEFLYKQKSLEQLLKYFFNANQNNKNKLTVVKSENKNNYNLAKSNQIDDVKSIILNLNTSEYVLFEIDDYEFLINKINDGFMFSITYTYKTQEQLLENAKINSKTLQEIWQKH